MKQPAVKSQVSDSSNEPKRPVNGRGKKIAQKEKPNKEDLWKSSYFLINLPLCFLY